MLFKYRDAYSPSGMLSTMSGDVSGCSLQSRRFTTPRLDFLCKAGPIGKHNRNVRADGTLC